MNYKIDNLQYCKWSREVFEINREAGLDAVHVTVVYHEDFQEFKNRVDEWNLHFKTRELNQKNQIIRIICLLISIGFGLQLKPILFFSIKQFFL